MLAMHTNDAQEQCQKGGQKEAAVFESIAHRHQAGSNVAAQQMRKALHVTEHVKMVQKHPFKCRPHRQHKNHINHTGLTSSDAPLPARERSAPPFAVRPSPLSQRPLPHLWAPLLLLLPWHRSVRIRSPETLCYRAALEPPFGAVLMMHRNASWLARAIPSRFAAGVTC